MKKKPGRYTSMVKQHDLRLNAAKSHGLHMQKPCLPLILLAVFTSLKTIRTMTSMPLRAGFLGIALLLSPGEGIAADPPHILIQGNQKIGFMGDSITAQGNAPDGYIGLVMYGLKVEGVDAIPIPAGVPGHTSGNMKSRVGPQILDQGANWMTLSCGVNDVMLQKKGKGVDLDSYKRNVAAMVDAALSKNVKVILMTATPLGEDTGNESNLQLAAYNDFLRAYAKEKSLPLAEVNDAFLDYLKTNPGPSETLGKRLLADGVHPNKEGQSLMAKALLIAMGVPASDIPKIEKAWMTNPAGKEIKLPGGTVVSISPAQYQTLVKLSRGHPGSVPGVIAKIWESAMAGIPDPTDVQKKAAREKLGSLVDEYIKKNATP